MRKIALLIIIYFLNLSAFAQGEASNWYFGYGGGLQFDQTNNTVTSVDNGQLFTNEGCTSISDASGNLLFYTDGSIVWNKNHQTMQNGTGLIGDFSSTQSAIIVPKPDDANIYYIFTVDDIKTQNDNTNVGLNYSEVDIRLDNGLGAITTKNVNLVKECSEKVSAVIKDCLTKSIWVVTFASQDGNAGPYNTFHAFEVSNSGVNTTAVTSPFPIGILDGRGYLKLSPDGTKMACANASDGVFLYDFNSTTGNITNQQRINVTGRSNKPYGVEFSPNSELLYVHYSNDFFGQGGQDPSNHTSALIQYNLLSTNISASAIVIDNRQLYRGGLQLGPNGKIYRALSATYSQGLPYLGAINNPNSLGTSCNYQHNAINLSPNNSSQGLPPFIASFFAQNIDIIGNDSASTSLLLCVGNKYTLRADIIPGAIYTWTRDGTPLHTNDTFLSVATEGLYEVIIDPNDGGCDTFKGIAYVTYAPDPVAYNHTLIQCDEDGVLGGFTRFNLNEANSILTDGIAGLSTKFYADSARNNEITNSDTYNYNTDTPHIIYVKVINDATGCSDISELTLEVSLTQINPHTKFLCDELESEDGINTFNLDDITSEIQLLNNITFPITYYATYENALLEKDDLGNSYTNREHPYSQTIYARAENANACYGISEVTLIVNKLPNIDTEAIAYYCLNKYPQKITINSGLNDSDNYTYNWSNGDSTYETQINEIGTYTVTITNKATTCSKLRTITVEASNIATFESIEVIDATQNNIITTLVSGEGIYEYRLLDETNSIAYPYQESNVFENVFPGIYTITVRDIKNDCGTVPSKVSVIGFPKFFTPNNDGMHDTWQVLGISSMFQPNSNILIYNRFGKLVKQLNPLSIGWDGLFNGEKLPTDDYWFEVTLQDGRTFKNHFTLKY